MAKPGKSELFLGVDVGGTKIYAALVKKSGRIVGRARRPTPRGAAPDVVLSAIFQTVEDVLAKKDMKPKTISAIGLAVPGVVDPDTGLVVEAPNINLTGQDVVTPMEEHFDIPVALGNDVNLGMLGEKWLGAAQLADSAVGIFVGTGIGGGIIMHGKLVRGASESAGEIGHITMQVNGPACGCGNKGCLEAFASRSAIERDIRAAVASGRRTLLTRLTRGNVDTIKSSLLKRALDKNDTLVTEVMRKASEYLGLACMDVRHLMDPDVIVLGGGPGRKGEDEQSAEQQGVSHDRPRG
jgi:glucokinase